MVLVDAGSVAAHSGRVYHDFLDGVPLYFIPRNS
jgi:hypothetical protein